MEEKIGVQVEKPKSRIGSVDVAKAISIFLVCWLHIAYNTVPNGLSGLVSYIMGTFFILSAYFYKPNQKYLSNVTKRIKQIVIPMAKYAVLVLLLFMLFLVIRGRELTGARSFAKLLEALGGVFYSSSSLTKIGVFGGNPNAYGIIVIAFWFLNRLFVSELIFFAIADWTIVSLKRLIPVAVGLILATFLLQHLIGYHLPLQLEVCFSIVALMLVGAYARQKNLLQYLGEKFNSVWYWVIVAVCVLAYWGLLQICEFGQNLSFGLFGELTNSETWHVFPWFVATLIGSYLFLVVCTFINKIPCVASAIKWIGARSMIILCFHMLVGEILLDLANQPNIRTVLFMHLHPLAVQMDEVQRFFIMLATFAICCVIAHLIDLGGKLIKIIKNNEKTETEKKGD